ncbi:MAG: hypothetical protein JW880_03540 [Candidatus Thermoplasmatota archaeon]|nr:hypothetical protein [Candidatus Thermoplasmatota archaeon]
MPISASGWPEDYLNGTITTISDVHGGFISYEGDSVTIEGVVTAAPDEIDAGYLFVQDSTGGIEVNATGSNEGSDFDLCLSRGDLVRLNGTVNQSHGMHRLVSVNSYWVVSSGNSIIPEHLYNVTRASVFTQGLLAKISGYLYNQSTDRADLWTMMYGFTVCSSTIDLTSYSDFLTVTGVCFFCDGVYDIRPRGSADIVNGTGPYHTLPLDGVLSGWTDPEVAVDDSDADSNWGASAEIHEILLTWDQDFLFVAADYTVGTGCSVVIYLDTYDGFGATNVSALDSWGRHVDFQPWFEADILIGRYEDQSAGSCTVLRVIDNAATTDISGSIALVATGTLGARMTVEVAIPWTVIYGGPVHVGALIHVVAVTTGSDNSNAADSAPDNPLHPDWSGWSHLDSFYSACIDVDLDIVVDDYHSEPVPIPEMPGMFVPMVSMVVMTVVLWLGTRRR